jgi:hypothetical protein
MDHYQNNNTNNNQENEKQSLNETVKEYKKPQNIESCLEEITPKLEKELNRKIIIRNIINYLKGNPIQNRTIELVYDKRGKLYFGTKLFNEKRTYQAYESIMKELGEFMKK